MPLFWYLLNYQCYYTLLISQYLLQTCTTRSSIFSVRTWTFSSFFPDGPGPCWNKTHHHFLLGSWCGLESNMTERCTVSNQLLNCWTCYRTTSQKQKHKPLHSAEPGKVQAGHALYESAAPPLPGATAGSAGSLAHSPPSWTASFSHTWTRRERNSLMDENIKTPPYTHTHTKWCLKTIIRTYVILRFSSWIFSQGPGKELQRFIIFKYEQMHPSATSVLKHICIQLQVLDLPRSERVFVNSSAGQKPHR